MIRRNDCCRVIAFTKYLSMHWFNYGLTVKPGMTALRNLFVITPVIFKNITQSRKDAKDWINFICFHKQAIKTLFGFFLNKLNNFFLAIFATLRDQIPMILYLQ